MSVAVTLTFGNNEVSWKDTVSDLNGGLEMVKQFCVTTWNLDPRSLRLQYVDEENDLITIDCGDDFNDALSLQSPARITVVGKVYDKEVDDNKQSEMPSNSNNTEGGNDNTSDLLQDLRTNQELRDEFASFVTTALITLKEDESHDVEQALVASLSAHETIAAHPQMKQMMARVATFAPWLSNSPMLPFLLNMDPNAIADMIRSMVSTNGNHNASYSPMFAFMAPMFQQLFPFGFNNNNNNEQQPGHDTQSDMGGMGFPFWSRGRGFRGRGFRGRGFGRHRFGGRGHRFGRGHFGHGHHHHGWDSGNHHHNHHNHHHHHHHHRNHHRGHGHRHPYSSEYNALVVDSDTTLRDKAIVGKGQTLIKTWTITNNGTNDWPLQSQIKYVGKPLNKMVDGASFPVPALKVGETQAIKVVVTAPQESGRFGSVWQLATDEHGLNTFGPKLKVRIVVLGDENDPKNEKLLRHVEKHNRKQQKREMKQALKQQKKERKQQQRFMKQQQKANQLLNKQNVIHNELQHVDQALNELQTASDDMQIDTIEAHLNNEQAINAQGEDSEEIEMSDDDNDFEGMEGSNTFEVNPVNQMEANANASTGAHNDNDIYSDDEEAKIDSILEMGFLGATRQGVRSLLRNNNGNVANVLTLLGIQ